MAAVIKNAFNVGSHNRLVPKPEITHSVTTVVWPHAAFKDAQSHSEEYARLLMLTPMFVSKALYVPHYCTKLGKGVFLFLSVLWK